MKTNRGSRAKALAALAGAALAVTAACGVKADGPPAIVVDRTACAHCGMFVSEPVYAAAYQEPGRDARVFDDIGCLFEAVRREPNIGALRTWVHDSETGTWMDGQHAVFVRSSAFRTPMGGGLIAFREPAAAERAARDHRGRVIRSLRDALAEAGKDGRP